MNFQEWYEEFRFNGIVQDALASAFEAGVEEGQRQVYTGEDNEAHMNREERHAAIEV